jgi:O-antigen/teichoic acid export membrane protein
VRLDSEPKQPTPSTDERSGEDLREKSPHSTRLTGGVAARNTAAMLASRIFVAALGLVGTMLIARKLPAVEWGYFSFVFGLLGMLAIITDLGVGRAVIGRLVHSEPEEVARIASSFIALRTVLGLVGYGVAIAYVLVLRYPSEVVWATVLGGIIVVVATPSNALTVLLQSTLRLTLVAAAEAFSRAVQFGLIVAGVLFAPYLLVLILPAVLREFVFIAIKIWGIAGGFAPRPSRHIELRWWGGMLLEALPISIGSALVIALNKVPILLLSQFDTFDSVGRYAIGFKFSDLIETAAVAIVIPTMTLFVATWPNELQRFRGHFRRATVVLTLLGLLAVVGFWPSARDVLRLLFGAPFTVATQSSRLQLIAGLLASLAYLGTVALISSGKNRVYPWIALFALTLNIALTLVLIPHLSFNGAAIATLTAQAVLVVGIGAALTYSLGIHRLLPLMSVASLSVTAATITAGTTVIQEHLHPPWILTSIAAASIFLVAAHVLKLTDGLNLANPRVVLR